MTSSPAREQPAGHDPHGASPEQGQQWMEVNEPCALRTNLEGAYRRHPDSSAAASALSLGARVGIGQILIRRGLARSGGTSSATCTESVGDPGDGDHRRVAAEHRFTVDMTDAQTPLEQLGDRLKWRRARHEDLRWHVQRLYGVVTE
jgi:hypothetical protein